MNANSPPQYPVNYYYVPDRKISPNVKLLQPNFEIKPSMDLCNLYIRGLKPEVTSTDLFNIFKPFGRIISARVMEDANNSCKAGFGFVSYSSSIEAAQAMIELNVVEQQSTTKSQEIEKKEKPSPIMTVRFHEPRVPRPEHNYSQQLELLSNSHLGPHFYTRHKQKIVPLKPTEDRHQPIMIPISSSDRENYSHLSRASPIPTTYLPVNNHNPPYYYIPSYWTGNQGIIYTNYVGSQPVHSQPTTSQYYHYNSQQSYNAKNESQHSWRDTDKTTAEDVIVKLLEMLKTECNVTSDDNPELVKKLKKLNRIEQSNCLNNSVYFRKKISLLMNNNNDPPSKD